MAVVSNKTTMTAGVAEKINLPDISDPKFGVFGGALVSGQSTTIDQVTTDIAGVMVSLNNRSYEGFGSGGYDKHFNVG
ncbi:MAG: hypothetical protein Q7R33_05035 [Nitrosarchaeum sp.]|nr:hypothetical protein [Nitrosarchaeum sp.]